MSSARDRPSAILDFALDARHAPRRLHFDGPSRIIRADALADVVPAIDEAERLARAGSWVIGFVAYEAAPAFDAALSVHPSGAIPLAWFAAFDAATEHAAEPPTASEIAAAPPARLEPRTALADASYVARVERIRDYIRRGDVYQVNLTVPFTAPWGASPVALYERMRAAQGGTYSAYLDLGDVQVMSASPELFLQRSGRLLRSRPMKGTALRGLHSRADAEARLALTRSEKDAAENVMIVDVVRNDLGRVALTGSVQVPTLCTPERYPRVWQLTSTVEAEVDPALALSAVFGALFPAGSITGAPKIRATSIIRELEDEPRGVYCGAVGAIAPGGDCTFNVAIRTAWTADGGRTVRLNAGGGVTMDSTPSGELAELRDKLAAFTVPLPALALFETLRVEGRTVLRLERHLARLAASADYFAIPFDLAAARALVADKADRCEPDAGVVSRARLVLAPDGALDLALEPFVDGGRAEPELIQLSAAPVDWRDLRLYHKSTSRQLYRDALAAAPGCFDVLLWNERKEITEFTRGNVVALIDGTHWTPPIECGLLGGILRGELVESAAVKERVIAVSEIRRAEAVWFVNALRGWVRVELERSPANEMVRDER